MSNKLKYLISLLIEVVGIVTISLAYNRIVEFFVITPLMLFFRRKHSKTFHAETFIQCSVSTVILYYILARIGLPLEISIGLSVVLAYITTEVLFFIQDYKDLLGIKQVKIRVGMNKTILEEKCKLYNLTDIETKILIHFYCDKLKRWQIGNILNYSEDNISKIKAKALDKFKKEPSWKN